MAECSESGVVTGALSRAFRFLGGALRVDEGEASESGSKALRIEGLV